MIRTQTDIQDSDTILKALDKYNGDIIAAIMHLNNIVECPGRQASSDKGRTEHDKHMDILRAIVDEKEMMFYNWKEGLATVPKAELCIDTCDNTNAAMQSENQTQ